jgi:hypothetical protein
MKCPKSLRVWLTILLKRLNKSKNNKQYADRAYDVIMAQQCIIDLTQALRKNGKSS